MVDYYQILQVSAEADAEVINAAYKARARKEHPDRNPGDPSANEEMRLLNEARDVLLDPLKRKKYDIQRQSEQSVKKKKEGSKRKETKPGTWMVVNDEVEVWPQDGVREEKEVEEKLTAEQEYIDYDHDNRVRKRRSRRAGQEPSQPQKEEGAPRAELLRALLIAIIPLAAGVGALWYQESLRLRSQSLGSTASVVSWIVAGFGAFLVLRVWVLFIIQAWRPPPGS